MIQIVKLLKSEEKHKKISAIQNRNCDKGLVVMDEQNSPQIYQSHTTKVVKMRIIVFNFLKSSKVVLKRDMLDMKEKEPKHK